MSMNRPISVKMSLGALMLVLLSVSACERQAQNVNLSVNVSATPPAQTKTAKKMWENIFYPQIDQLTTDAGLEKLRSNTPSQNALEIRIWVGVDETSTRALVLRRTGDQWSAAYLPSRNSLKSSSRLISLPSPKSGWTVLWERLNREEILTLPDASEVGADNVYPDALAIVVEVRSNDSYRAYNYNGFDTSDHLEAKKITSICKIISEEFNLILC